MGMYNEVSTKCPHCADGRGELQIPQIVLGFGGFALDDPERLAELLNEDQMHELAALVKNKWFVCRNILCERSFLLEESRKAREDLARKLFG